MSGTWGGGCWVSENLDTLIKWNILSNRVARDSALYSFGTFPTACSLRGIHTKRDACVVRMGSIWCIFKISKLFQSTEVTFFQYLLVPPSKYTGFSVPRDHRKFNSSCRHLLIIIMLLNTAFLHFCSWDTCTLHKKRELVSPPLTSVRPPTGCSIYPVSSPLSNSCQQDAQANGSATRTSPRNRHRTV